MEIGRLIFLPIMIFGMMCCSAKADLTLGFSLDGGSTFVNETNTLIGDSITVAVYTLDTANQLSDFGLGNVGTTAVFNTTFGNVTSATLKSNFIDTGNTGFDNGIGEVSFAGLSFSPANNAANPIEIGEFTFQVVSIGTTVFEFGDFDPTLTVSNFTLGDSANTDLDPDLFGADRTATYNFTIAVVPEPSVFGIAIFGLIPFSMRRSRYTRLN